MCSSSNLLLGVGLLFLACSISCVQSQNETAQIAPTSSVTDVDSSSAQNVSETTNTTASSLSASEGVIQPSATLNFAESSSVDPLQSAEVSIVSAVVDSSLELSSSADFAASANSLELSASQVPVEFSTTYVVSSSDVLESLDIVSSEVDLSISSASQSIFLVQSSAFENETFSDGVQSTAVGLVDSESLSTGAGYSSSESIMLDPSATAQIPDMSASEELESASLSASMMSATATMTETAAISPSSTVMVSPSSSVPMPGGGASGGSTSPIEEKEKDGGGGGMSSGAKAAVGIFVTIAVIALIVVGVVLYRRNYLSPRNIKSMMKGGVRYQTHNDSMSYNDEMDFH